MAPLQLSIKFLPCWRGGQISDCNGLSAAIHPPFGNILKRFRVEWKLSSSDSSAEPSASRPLGVSIRKPGFSATLRRCLHPPKPGRGMKAVHSVFGARLGEAGKSTYSLRLACSSTLFSLGTIWLWFRQVTRRSRRPESLPGLAGNAEDLAEMKSPSTSRRRFSEV